MKRSYFASPYVIWMIVFTIMPLLFVVYYAFTNSGGAFSLASWQSYFTEGNMRTLWASIKLAIECTAICLVVGYPAAMFLASKDLSKNKALFVLILLPMWMNFLLRTYAMRELLRDGGVLSAVFGWLNMDMPQLLYTEGAVLLGMVYNYLPFMILPIYTCLKKMDQRVIEAAEDLGANPLQVFARVRVPLSIPGVMSGITMVFMPAVTTFALSKILGGGMTPMVGDQIELQFITFGNWQMGSTISLILLVLIIASLALLRKVDPDNEGGGMW
ncbi:MAG: ABC transporter permease [Clostridia bacterium]|nr:ABC transporter permease [Clostridia bacterium]